MTLFCDAFTRCGYKHPTCSPQQRLSATQSPAHVQQRRVLNEKEKAATRITTISKSLLSCVQCNACVAASTGGFHIHRVVPVSVMVTVSSRKAGLIEIQGVSSCVHEGRVHLGRSSSASRPFNLAGPFRVRTTISALLMPQEQPVVSLTRNNASPICMMTSMMRERGLASTLPSLRRRSCRWRTSKTSHVTRHTSHVTRHTTHVTRHTSHVTRHTSHVTRHTPTCQCLSLLKQSR